MTYPKLHIGNADTNRAEIVAAIRERLEAGENEQAAKIAWDAFAGSTQFDQFCGAGSLINEAGLQPPIYLAGIPLAGGQ